MEGVLVAVGALLVIALSVAAGRAPPSWRGSWRWLAVVVVLGVASWAVKILIDVRRDPTAHNWWPFEAIGVVDLALLVLGGIALARGRAIKSR